MIVTAQQLNSEFLLEKKKKICKHQEDNKVLSSSSAKISLISLCHGATDQVNRDKELVFFSEAFATVSNLCS